MWKYLFIILFGVFAIGATTNAPIIWGPDNSAQILQSRLTFFGSGTVSAVGAGYVDPRIVATFGYPGSIFMSSNSDAYIKKDSGTTTNWEMIDSGGGGGTVTQIDTGNGLTGGPITTSGTISLSAPVSIANGGTNNTSAYTAGSVIFSSGTALTQDNSNLFFDDTANALGVGTASVGTDRIAVQSTSGSQSVSMGAASAPNTTGTDSLGRNLSFHAGDGNGTNKVGGNLSIQSGNSTGSATAGGAVLIETTSTGSSGTSVNSRAQRAYFGELGVLIGNGSTGLATNAVNGHFYVPSMAGIPSGTPSLIGVGANPIVIDSTNHNLYFYSDTSWFKAIRDFSAGTGILPIANGGTNKALTLAAGGLVWTDADSFEVTAAGSAGQHLQSAGAGSPTWTTATFPATATGTGTILRADGTNWVASTATYPTTVTAQRLLYGSATNVVSDLATPASSALISDASGNLTWLDGSTSGNVLRTAAAGAIQFGKVALTTDVSGTLPINKGGTNSTSAASAGSVAYSTSTAFAWTAVGSASQILQSGGTGAPTWSTATYPATATSAGTFLRSDGTNWLVSGTTIPDTGSVGGILGYSAAGVLTSTAAPGATGRFLRSVNGGTPTWSTLTIPATSGATSVMVSQTANSTSFLQGLTANRVLRTDGTTIAFSQADLTTDVTGTLPVANGGTGATSLADKNLLLGGNTGPITALTEGTAGQILTSGGAADPAWITLVPIANGGTNKALTLSAGGIPYFDADSFEVLAAGTSTQLLSSGGTGAPTWINRAATTYAPTITGVANIDAVTSPGNGVYFQVGAGVTVCGVAAVDPTTTATTTSVGVSLPVASNFAASSDMFGTCTFEGGLTTNICGVVGDATNDRAQVNFNTVGTGNASMRFCFTYPIL